MCAQHSLNIGKGGNIKGTGAVLRVWVGKAGEGEAQRMLQVWEVSVSTWLRGDGAGKERDLCFQGWGCRM